MAENLLRFGLSQAIRRAGFEIKRIKPPVAEPARTVPTSYLQIPGWFTPEEAGLLYLVALQSRGPILEIGHFLGRSTSILCEAIRDSGNKNDFISYDLEFRSAGDFEDFYRRMHRNDTLTVHPLYEKVFMQGMTTSEVARRNLQELRLHSYVQLISGDFAQDTGSYSLIFCDAVHDRYEIEANLPGIQARSGERVLWALHDMTPEKITLVTKMSNAQLLARARSLAVFRYR